MLCFEDRKSCVKIFTCCNNENDSSATNEDKVKIEIIHTQNSSELPGKKVVVTSESDNNSESDSGVGSVRDSSNDSGKESMTSKIPIKLVVPQSTSTTAKVNRVKSVKRSESLLSRFSFIFPSGGEKLSDILVEEFKKNDRTTGIALERMFSSNSMNSIPEESTTVPRPTEVKKQLKKKKSLKQLINGKHDSRLPKVEEKVTDQKNESTPDVPTTPEMDLENREKKKRKKRRFQRKNIDAEESESSSTSSSNRGKERPVIRKPSQKVAESK